MFRIDPSAPITYEPAARMVVLHSRISGIDRILRLHVDVLATLGLPAGNASEAEIVRFLQEHREHVETEGATAWLVALAQGNQIASHLEWSPAGLTPYEPERPATQAASSRDASVASSSEANPS
jgi:hypothetical protein